jgi:hypothetical protein
MTEIKILFGLFKNDVASSRRDISPCVWSRRHLGKNEGRETDGLLWGFGATTSVRRCVPRFIWCFIK